MMSQWQEMYYVAILKKFNSATDGECSNAIDALVFLQNNKVDLIFLDIRMPELLGTEFVQSLQNPPKIIFTTAFKEYALGWL
jgi:two-component SAPR family response regulator